MEHTFDDALRILKKTDCFVGACIFNPCFSKRFIGHADVNHCLGTIHIILTVVILILLIYLCGVLLTIFY